MIFSDKADEILGIRAWGLLLYGALPANLALIGTLEVKLTSLDKLTLPIICLTSLLPLFVTFLLVHRRCKEWYLTSDFLLSRSLVTTFLIILCASLICGAAGLINGKYVFSLTNVWNEAHFKAVAESYLFGISSLVITSTLFMTIFTKATDLPLLPSSTFVASLEKIRNNIRLIRRNSIFKKNDISDDYENVTKIQEIIKTVNTSFDEILSYSLRKKTKKSFEILKESIDSLDKALLYIKDAEDRPDIREDRWKLFFEKDDNTLTVELKSLREVRDKEYKAVLMIKNLRIGE